MKKISFSLPLIDKEVIQEVNSCLTETGWITTGPKVRELEESITNLCETNATICVNSWTSAMLLLIKWLSLDEKDEIIVPVYTYAASALSVINSGVKCVFVDVNEDYTLNINKVEEAITENTKAILPVDVGGLPADYLELKKILTKKNVLKKFTPKTKFQKLLGRPVIIADAAHSIGSTINGSPTALFSDFTIFSFHSVKNITTGEGGAITFKINDREVDSEILKELKLLSLNGQNKTAFEKNSIGGWKYDIITNGLKVNMPDINAAIGISQIRRYKNILLPEREKIANKYNELLSKYSWAILPIQETEGRKSSYHLYQLRIKGFSESQRDQLINKLSANYIGVNVHYIPLPMLSFFKARGLKIEDYPTSYSLYANEISLPLYNNLPIEDVEYLCEKLVGFINEMI